MLQEIFEPFVSKHQVSRLAACRIRPEGIVEQFWHDADAPDANPLTIPFPIASLSKSFAAAAILLLRNEGALELSDSVISFIPELHDRIRWGETTIFDLLTMGSGLATDNPWGDRQLFISDSDFDRILKAPMLFSAEIGEEYHYSNLGYMMLGRIITRVSGTHALEFIQNRILDPLEMLNSDWRNISSDAGVFGGLTSTLEDMSRWVRFFLESNAHEKKHSALVFGRKTKQEQQRVAHLMPVDYFCPDEKLRPAAYACGLVRYAHTRNWAAGHSGGLPGSGCHMRWSVEYGAAVVGWGLSTYCPVWTPGMEIIENVVTQTLPSYPIPSALTTECAGKLKALITRWNDAVADQLFSSNFFQDMPREQAMTKLEQLKQRISGKVDELELIGERGLAAFFSHHGSPLLVFNLAPSEEGRIQELRFTKL